MSMQYQRNYYHCLKTLLKHRVFAFGKEIVVEVLQNNCLQESRTFRGNDSTTELSYLSFTSSPPSSLIAHSSYVINSLCSCFTPASVLHLLLHDLLCLSAANQDRVTLLSVKSLVES